MRVDSGHYHARTTYKETSALDYLRLVEDLAETKKKGGKSLNVHLPFEIQHPHIYTDTESGLRFIRFGELAKRPFDLPLYWENAPEQDTTFWELAHGQTKWHLVPHDIDLTLDTGHLMLGIGPKGELAARNRIEGVLYQRGKQIKHLHLHENDFIHDEHWRIGRVITEEFFQRMTNGRTYIFEAGEDTGNPTNPPYEPLTHLYSFT